jgi:5'-nucleotidase
VKVLLTNDDGIFAEGLQVMTRQFEKIATTYVVAPDHEQSATGHAITMHRPLRAEKVKFLHSPELFARQVNGTPADCVKLAVEAVLPEKVDLVVSGINRGANLGTDVLYSGTVSAAIEGAILGLPAIAVSLTEDKEPRYEYAAEFICRLAQSLVKNGMPAGTLLNVNVPGCSREQIKGVAVTRLGVRQYRNAFARRTDPRGRTYYWLAGELIDVADGDDTDAAAIRNCKVSVTPIHFDLTSHDTLDSLKQWVIKV